MTNQTGWMPELIQVTDLCKCHINGFVGMQFVFLFAVDRLELESEKMRQCRNQEEIDACRDRIETLQEEIAIKK